LLNTCIEADVVCAGIVSLIFSLPIGIFLCYWPVGIVPQVARK
jgi:hypothetical protein